MAAGDVTVQVVDSTTTAVDTAMTAMRVSANDHWMMTSIQNGQKILIAHVEEV